MDQDSDKKNIGREVFATFNLRLLQLLFSFLTSVMVARLLGPEVKGVLGLIFTFIATSSFLFSFGLGSSLIYHGAGRHTVSELLPAFSFWGLLILVAYLPVSAAFYLIFGKSVLKGVAPEYFFLSLSLFPLFLLNLVSGSLAKALGKIRQAARVMFAKEAVFFCCMALAVLALGKGAGWIISSRILAELLGMIFMFAVIGREVAWRDFLPVYDPALTKTVFGYGIKSHLGNIFQPYNHKADIFILNYFAGPLFVGVYSVGLSMAEYLLILPSVICFVLLPRVSAAGKAAGAAYTISFARRTIWLMAAAGLGMISILHWFIPFVFGAPFTGAKYAVYALFPGSLALSLSWILGAYFEGTGNPGIVMRANALVFVVNLVLNVLLIPMWGFMGCAAASTLSYTLAAGLLLNLFAKETGTPRVALLEFRFSDFSPGRIFTDLGYKVRG